LLVPSDLCLSVLSCEDGLAGTRCPRDEHAGAASQATTEESVEGLRSAGNSLAADVHAWHVVEDSRINLESACCDPKVMIATAEARSADLDYLQPPALGAVLESNVLERNDPVRKTMQLAGTLRRAFVVEQQH